MEYLHEYKGYKIYQQNDLFYAMKSYGQEITGNQISYKGIQKYVAPSISLLNDMIDKKCKPQKIKFQQTKLF